MESFHIAHAARREEASPAQEHSADRPVVIAIDFSDDSKAALEWGIEEAAFRNAPATILHVIHDPAEAPGSYHKKQENIMVPLTETAEQIFDEFIDDCSSEIPALKTMADRSVRRKLVEGVPVRRILEFAETSNAQMIVMGSRGQTGFKHLLIGSKAEEVAQHASVPVMIVKAQSRKSSG